MNGCCNNIKPASIYFTLFDRLSKMRIELKMSFGCWVYLLRKGQKSVWTEFVLWLFKKKWHLGDSLACWNIDLHVGTWLPQGGGRVLWWLCALRTSLPYKFGRETQTMLYCCRRASLGSSQEATFPFRLPRAFQTFRSLWETFPEVSGYCYCVDSLGRELAETGESPPASDPLTGVALNSQGKGQTTFTHLQINLGLRFHSYKG